MSITISIIYFYIIFGVAFLFLCEKRMNLSKIVEETGKEVEGLSEEEYKKGYSLVYLILRVSLIFLWPIIIMMIIKEKITGRNIKNNK